MTDDELAEVKWRLFERPDKCTVDLDQARQMFREIEHLQADNARLRATKEQWIIDCWEQTERAMRAEAENARLRAALLAFIHAYANIEHLD